MLGKLTHCTRGECCGCLHFMHLAFVWWKEWAFFSPNEFHIHILSLTELSKRLCSVHHLLLTHLEAVAQDRTRAFGACGTQHSGLGSWFAAFFQISEHSQKGRQSSGGDRNVFCTHHAVFTRDSVRQIASATPFFICNQSGCLQITQLLLTESMF